jgi:hypothetical protein
MAQAREPIRRSLSATAVQTRIAQQDVIRALIVDDRPRLSPPMVDALKPNLAAGVLFEHGCRVPLPAAGTARLLRGR